MYGIHVTRSRGVTGGICQIYSPVFVWDDVITRVYIIIMARFVP